MAVLRSSILTAASALAFQALAAAQTTPPPGEPMPPGGVAPGAPAAPAPAYPPPPPAGNQQQPPPPGYQQQPPPPGYQQPPPGYQQQAPQPYPPPQQAYPQPPPPGTYQPPPGYYQPPPSGYYQPPPGYYPPPGYGYAPPRPPSPPPRTHGFLAMPYLGFASHVGTTGSDLGPGFMIGALLGGRVNPSFSLNGELRVDALNYRNLAVGDQRTGTEGDLAFSPLFHVQFQAGEFVVGPKFGFFFYDETDTSSGFSNNQYSASGVTYGVNAGVFFAVGRVMSLGGMVSYTVRDASERCQTPFGGSQQCTSANYAAEDIFGFHAAILF